MGLSKENLEGHRANLLCATSKANQSDVFTIGASDSIRHALAPVLVPELVPVLMPVLAATMFNQTLAEKSLRQSGSSSRSSRFLLLTLFGSSASRPT